MRILTLENDKITELSPNNLTCKNNIWIRSINPSAKEIALLSKLIHAPEEEFKEFLKEDERPRLDLNKYTQLIYRIPFLEDGSVVTMPVSVFVYKKFIVTVEKQQTGALNYIESLVLQNKRRFLFKKSAMTFLTYFIDRVNDEFFATTHKIADTLEMFKVTEGLTKEMTKKVYSLSVTLSFFNQSLIGNIEVLNNLRKSKSTAFSSKDKDNFKELYVDALQIFDAAKVQREIVLNLFNLQSIIASARMNEYIKKLTIITLVIMIPTFITGLYGMNLALPLADSPGSFYIVLGVMIVAAVVGVGLFKFLERF
jgi:magnesium transporter